MAGRIKVTTARLLQIAGGIFVTGSFGLYLAQNAVQSKVRKFPHYSEAFEIISQHEKLMDTLGTPIRVGKVDLADRTSNYVAVTDSKFRVPISGPLGSGFLNIVATRDDKDDVFKTSKLLFEGDEGDFLIYER